MKYNKALLSILMCLILFSVGCEGTTDKGFDQGLQLIEKAAELAERQGTAYNATIRWDGTIEGAWKQGIELNSGVTAEVSFHGNAAAERQSTSQKDNPNDP